MLDPGLLAFACGALPAPARVLEIGAGGGELAAALREMGHDVTAIDRAAEPGAGVEPVALIDATGSFDVAVAVLSLHHVEPLGASCERLAELVLHGGLVLIDELDVTRLDERATTWWLHQRRAAGHEDEHDPAGMVESMREHIHPLEAVVAALTPYFTLGEPVRGPYLHRWHLEPGLRDAEERLIGAGRLPATGARLVGVRRA